MTEKELDYIETIMDLLNQACYVEDPNEPNASIVDHQCMSSYEHATALLEELGFAKETSLSARTYYLFPKKIEEARHSIQQTEGRLFPAEQNKNSGLPEFGRNPPHGGLRPS